MSFTTIEAIRLGVADGGTEPTPLAGSVTIQPRFRTARDEEWVYLTGPIVVQVEGGQFPETLVPAMAGATASVHFRLAVGERAHRLPATEVPLEPDTRVDLREFMPAGVDPVTGVALLRGDPGPAGASVVGGRDLGDGTIVFLLSDGSETDPVAVPPGPAGRGIESVTGADGTATVTFTDGTAESFPLPPGPPGTDGVSPPPPEIAWDGSHLVVGGERSPDLTGPEGPAPAVSWDGPRLTVGGVTGPDLTGPEGAASTVPGPPGAVPTAGDYAIVGPGRPDVPASTGGLVSASTPVGATYTSTDGAGVGAWQWLKTGAGWIVTVGDTGWRSLPLLIEGTATVIIRRTTTAGVMARAMTNAEGTRVILATIPGGFRASNELGTSHAIVTAGRFGNEAGLVAGDIYYLMPQHGIAINSPNAALNKGGLTWTPTDPWPNTLP